jgi:multidrug efflux system membrane fusion protein
MDLVTLGKSARVTSVAALVVMLSACDQPKTQSAAPPPPVTVARPVVKEIVERDEFTGRFDAVGSVEIRARVTGYLSSVNFTDGGLVNQGDLLFVIDRRPYAAALAQAEAAVTSARTAFDLAKVELDRADRLMQNGNTSQQNLDSRRQQFAAGRANLAGAEATAEQARLNLGFTEIKAPIAGRISRKLVTEGNLIETSGTLLTTIVSLDPINFYFDVDERSYLAYLRTARENNPAADGGQGEKVTLTLPDERGSQRTGRIDFVDNRIDAGTGTMRMRAVFENKDLFLVPGLFARIRIPGSPSYQAVLVPDEAIGADQDRRFVYAVADDGSVARKVIRTGPRVDGYRVVREGLAGDETIVVSGLQRVRPGGKVTPQLAELPPQR